MNAALERRYGHAARMTASEILKVADARIDYATLGLDASDPRTRRAYYDRRLRRWIVEVDTDPVISYEAHKADDGTIRLERLL